MDRVRVLLSTRNDYLPQPRSLELPSESGVAGGRRVPCECRTGRVRRGKTVLLCLVCNGTAWRLRRPGEPEWDEYIGARVGGAETKTLRSMTPRELDESITRLRRNEATREGRVAADDLIGWERGRRARDASGSYAELERALELLRDRSYALHRLLDLIYGAGVALEMSEAMARREELAIRWLANTMRGAVRIPAWAWEAETEKLVDEVKRLGVEGLKVSEIASELGMSQRRVKQLLGRRIPA